MEFSWLLQTKVRFIFYFTKVIWSVALWSIYVCYFGTHSIRKVWRGKTQDWSSEPISCDFVSDDQDDVEPSFSGWGKRGIKCLFWSNVFLDEDVVDRRPQRRLSTWWSGLRYRGLDSGPDEPEGAGWSGKIERTNDFLSAGAPRLQA